MRIFGEFVEYGRRENVRQATGLPIPNFWRSNNFQWFFEQPLA